MTEILDPVRTSAEIIASYRRYLGSLIASRDPKVGAALTRAIDESPMLDRGPYLEATPPYAPGSTLQELIDEGVLSPGFADLASPALPLRRPLYRHQEASIRKVRDGRNVVVATGTGSGKTESFLLPILDSLVREKHAGTLGPGVRALLLYPMNALANDQMKRLRALLKDYPHITFGRYTGDTESDPQKARDSFDALNPGEEPIPNELLSREEMRKAPPHILLTNYAMLEYLLLRPQDMALFPAAGRQTWRFLAIDEAHVYDGTQGAEIGLLVRRLRDRVAPDRELQCIATSATVGSDSDPESVVEFASRLFGVPFEWVQGSPSRQDLITAQRVAVPQGPFWGPLSAQDYRTLLASEDAGAAVLALASAHGFAGENAAHALAHEQGLADLKRILRLGPQPFDSLVGRICPGEVEARDGLVAMVALASKLTTPDGSPALSARYHLFLRATEGAFLCLSDLGPHVHLARHDLCEDCEAPVFELGACRRCGAVHLIGALETRNGRPTLQPRSPAKNTTWLALGAADDRVDEDEEVVESAAVGVEGERARLCTKCRTLSATNAGTCENPDCGATALRDVSRLKKGGQELAGCLVCGARGAGTVRAFETGSDAAGAVITTALYQALPSSSDPDDLLRPGEGRKLLMFNDSRQAAAFFAPYLEDTYGRLQRRRLVHQGLEKAGAADDLAYPSDVIADTRTCAAAVKLFSRRISRSEQDRIVAPWVMAEAVSVDDRQSLEGVGLVRISLDRDPAWRAPRPLLDLGLSEDESWDLIAELVRTLRMQGAVTMPENVSPADDVFAPRFGPIYARKQGPEARHKVLAWLPARGTNRRVDYVTKILAKLGRPDDATLILGKVWDFLTAATTPVDWLARTQQKGLGELRQVDHELLRFRLVSDDATVYRCDTCQRVAPVSVREVCPSLSCSGSLSPFVPSPKEADSDHYRAIYRGMYPVPLKAMEHTAQWLNTEAAKIQQSFIQGEVNALSCSTTFELGVDVGELQAVVLRNVPPSTANYVQRAGRAGRRAGAAALVVTYAQRRSHDLAHFAAPETMMTGTIRAPYVPLDNERIDRRHAYSVVLSAFFRRDLEVYHRISRKAGEFFLDSDTGEAPVKAVRQFLQPTVPPEVEHSLERVLPEQVKLELGLADGAWVEELLTLLAEVGAEIANDIQILSDLEKAASAAGKHKLADKYQQVKRTILGRDLLGFLANHNVIPKYGFPVDTVELRTDFGAGAVLGRRLELSRDLSQAIHEYAPDATLVAGAQLWTSRGVYRLPGKELEQYNYRVCEFCGHYSEAVGELADGQCPVCAQVPTSGARKFLIPEFGFVADPNPTKVGNRPPERSWSGATHVAKLSDQATERTITLTGGRIEVSVGPRGRLISVADGRGGRGYWVCGWCGWGTSAARAGRPPRQHDHLLRAGTTCNGPLSHIDFAHRYETDLLSLSIKPNHGSTIGDATWKSVLYAILEAASESQQIARDDIDGAIRPVGRYDRSVVLFDTVPGGGGNVLRIAAHLEDVLSSALRRVEGCECGEETSCYRCLRSYRNQRDHELLSRGAAAGFLRALGAESARLTKTIPIDWRTAIDAALDEEKPLLLQLAGRGTIPPPELGLETDDGVPISIAWAEHHVATGIGVGDSRREDWQSSGWVFAEPTVSAVEEALAAVPARKGDA